MPKKNFDYENGGYYVKNSKNKQNNNNWILIINQNGITNLSNQKIEILKGQLSKKLDDIASLSIACSAKIDENLDKLILLLSDYCFNLLKVYLRHITLETAIYQQTISFEKQIFTEFVSQLSAIVFLFKQNNCKIEDYPDILLDSLFVLQKKVHSILQEANNLHPLRTASFTSTIIEIDEYLYFWTELFKELNPVVEEIINRIQMSQIDMVCL